VAVLAGKALHSNRAVEDVVLAVAVDDNVADAVVLAAAVDGFVAEAVDDIVLVDDGFVADAVADVVVVVDKPLHKQDVPVAAAAAVVVVLHQHTLEALRCKKHRYTTQIRELGLPQRPRPLEGRGRAVEVGQGPFRSLD
jgi:hypothetical protein